MRLVLVLVVVGCGNAHPPPPERLANTTPAPVKAPSDAVLAWPVAAFSAEQLAEARACDLDHLVDQRYPKALATSALTGAFPVATTCDRAVLAAACAEREKDTPPPVCLDAYRATVRANPAFAFTTALAAGYFGKVHVVAPPPAHALSKLTLDYEWSGLGTEVAWTLTVKDATATVTGKSAKALKTPPDVATLAGAFATSLDSFLPIKEPLEAVDCTDNYPKWTATLELDNGDKLELSTHGSNLIGLGGPWQLTLQGTTYLQLSPGLVRATGALVQALDLPLGEPEGMTCSGYDIGKQLLGS